MYKFITLIFLSLFISNGQASELSMRLRCFDFFTERNTTTAKVAPFYYAEAIDALNQKYNHFLFKQDLQSTIQPNFEGLSLGQNIRARYESRKLKNILKDLRGLDQSLKAKAQFKIYDLEKIAKNLEKLTFIIDDSQTQKMSSSDKIIFKQIQHSLLTKGLSDFLFTNTVAISDSKIQIIKNQILAPFKKVYLRWILAPIMMPHLDGAVIPYDVIEKVIWQGYDKSKDLLEPYLKTTQGKHVFNVFSSGYNFLVTGLIIISTVTWIQTTTTETYAAYNRGVAHAEEMLKPALENAKTLANKNLSQEFRSDTLQISIEKFKDQFHREPTDHEVELIKLLISASEN